MAAITKDLNLNGLDKFIVSLLEPGKMKWSCWQGLFLLRVVKKDLFQTFFLVLKVSSHCLPSIPICVQISSYKDVCVCVSARLLQSCPTLCNPMDWSPPGSSVCGILQARILEWVAKPSCRGSFQSRDWTASLSLLHCRQLLHHWSHLDSPLIRTSVVLDHSSLWLHITWLCLYRPYLFISFL